MARIVSFEKCSNLLESYIQSGSLNFIIGSGASRPAINLAGDVESQIDELLVGGFEEQANLLALDFIENLEEEHDNHILGVDGGNFQTTLENYICFVTNVDKLLFERKNHLLSRQANLFTTNYDLFVEIAASRLTSLILNDGFDRSSSLTADYKYKSEQFQDRTYRSANVYSRQTEVPTLNLFKLHGSINWKKIGSEISLRVHDIRRLSDSDKSNPELVRDALDNRIMILPNLKKFNSTLVDRVYYDLLRFYANSLERENALLVAFGFSFEDKHILDVTKRSLRNPTSQLIIFSHKLEDSESFAQKFEGQRNVTIIVPGEDTVIAFPELNGLLGSIAPEEYSSDE